MGSEIRKLSNKGKGWEGKGEKTGWKCKVEIGEERGPSEETEEFTQSTGERHQGVETNTGTT